MANIQTPEQVKQMMETSLPSDQAKLWREAREQFKSSPLMDALRKSEKDCNEFMNSDKGGDSNTLGYILCCDYGGYCGSGMSAWVIVIIIIVILGCIAAGGAAFFFFYWNRKMGGRDEEEVEDKEIQSGDTSKSEHEISVDTY
ncbi:hypothetical protein B9Z55_007798 [Caenorhabditis nigoni]|nr:hypothetical protein B9Z55_007798 [Caenorhabditis nigoni]